MKTTHVDFSEVVIKHFTRTGELHSGILDMSADCIEELIDAVPEKEEALLYLLRTVWKDVKMKEGVFS